MDNNRTLSKTVREIENKRYSIILLLMSIITLFGLIKFRAKFNVKSFCVYMFIGSIFGWSWQIFVTYMDPQYAGWWYESHKIWGSVGLVAYEDIVFYPICGALFYLIRLIMPGISVSPKLNFYFKLLTLITICSLGIISLIIFNTGGRSSTYWFLIPGLGMYIFSYKNINIPRFLFTGIFIIVLASVWDLWIKDWFYITANLQHSICGSIIKHTGGPGLERVPWKLPLGLVFVAGFLFILLPKYVIPLSL
jgi:hypothetical protein